MPTPVEVVVYDDAWPQAYAAMSKHLASLLGLAVIAIDHVGSTAVPGLAAKPVIDIDVTMRDPDAICTGSAALAANGFVGETGMMTASGHSPRRDHRGSVSISVRLSATPITAA